MKRATFVSASCAAAICLAIAVRNGIAAEERGFLGVFLSPPSASPEAGGARVEEVAPGSAAEKAGLRPGDVITAVNGEKVEGSDALRNRMQSFRRDDAVDLDVRRGEETLKVQARLDGPPAESQIPADEAEKAAKRRGFLGIGFAEVPPALADHLELEEGSGVLVGDVWKDSPAQKAGIAKNDVIVSVDGKPVRNSRELAAHLEAKNAGDTLKIGLFHKGKKTDLEVTLGPRPPELRRSGLLPGASRRIIIESPDGSRRTFGMADDLWPTDEILRELHENAGSFREWKHPEEWLGRLRSLVDELESELGQPGAPGGGAVRSERSSTSVLRVKEGEYDITISERNGNRTVTVKQGDTVLAEEMPYAEIEEKLPEEARERVKKAAANFESTPRIEIPEKKIKA